MDNRPNKAPLGIYLLEEPGKELTPSGLDITRTRVISKGGLKGILRCNTEIEKDTLERLPG